MVNQFDDLISYFLPFIYQSIENKNYEQFIVLFRKCFKKIEKLQVFVKYRQKEQYMQQQKLKEKHKQKQVSVQKYKKNQSFYRQKSNSSSYMLSGKQSKIWFNNKQFQMEAQKRQKDDRLQEFKQKMKEIQALDQFQEHQEYLIARFKEHYKLELRDLNKTENRVIIKNTNYSIILIQKEFDISNCLKNSLCLYKSKDLKNYMPNDLLELTIYANDLKNFQVMYENSQITQKSLDLSLKLGNSRIVIKTMDGFFKHDFKQIAEYIEKNKVLQKQIKQGRSQLVIDLINKFIKPLSDYYYQDKYVLQFSNFEESFFDIIFYKMRDLFIYVIDYFQQRMKDNEKMRELLSNSFNKEYQQGSQHKYSCYQIATMNRFYEFFSICKYYNIKYTINDYRDIQLTEPFHRFVYIQNIQSELDCINSQTKQYLEDYQIRIQSYHSLQNELIQTIENNKYQIKSKKYVTSSQRLKFKQVIEYIVFGQLIIHNLKNDQADEIVSDFLKNVSQNYNFLFILAFQAFKNQAIQYLSNKTNLIEEYKLIGIDVAYLLLYDKQKIFHSFIKLNNQTEHIKYQLITNQNIQNILNKIQYIVQQSHNDHSQSKGNTRLTKSSKQKNHQSKKKNVDKSSQKYTISLLNDGHESNLNFQSKNNQTSVTMNQSNEDDINSIGIQILSETVQVTAGIRLFFDGFEYIIYYLVKTNIMKIANEKEFFHENCVNILEYFKLCYYFVFQLVGQRLTNKMTGQLGQIFSRIGDNENSIHQDLVLSQVNFCLNLTNSSFNKIYSTSADNNITQITQTYLQKSHNFISIINNLLGFRKDIINIDNVHQILQDVNQPSQLDEQMIDGLVNNYITHFQTINMNNKYEFDSENISQYLQNVYQVVQGQYDKTILYSLGIVDIYIQLMYILAQTFYFVNYGGCIENQFNQQIFQCSVSLAEQTEQSYQIDSNIIKLTIQVQLNYDKTKNMFYISAPQNPHQQRDIVIYISQVYGLDKMYQNYQLTIKQSVNSIKMIQERINSQVIKSAKLYYFYIKKQYLKFQQIKNKQIQNNLDFCFPQYQQSINQVHFNEIGKVNEVSQSGEQSESNIQPSSNENLKYEQNPIYSNPKSNSESNTIISQEKQMVNNQAEKEDYYSQTIQMLKENLQQQQVLQDIEIDVNINKLKSIQNLDKQYQILKYLDLDLHSITFFQELMMDLLYLIQKEILDYSDIVEQMQPNNKQSMQSDSFNEYDENVSPFQQEPMVQRKIVQSNQVHQFYIIENYRYKFNTKIILKFEYSDEQEQIESEYQLKISEFIIQTLSEYIEQQKTYNNLKDQQQYLPMINNNDQYIFNGNEKEMKSIVYSCKFNIRDNNDNTYDLLIEKYRLGIYQILKLKQLFKRVMNEINMKYPNSKININILEFYQFFDKLLNIHYQVYSVPAIHENVVEKQNDRSSQDRLNSKLVTLENESEIKNNISCGSGSGMLSHDCNYNQIGINQQQQQQMAIKIMDQNIDTNLIDKNQEQVVLETDDNKVANQEHVVQNQDEQNITENSKLQSNECQDNNVAVNMVNIQNNSRQNTNTQQYQYHFENIMDLITQFCKQSFLFKLILNMLEKIDGKLEFDQIYFRVTDSMIGIKEQKCRGDYLFDNLYNIQDCEYQFMSDKLLIINFKYQLVTGNTIYSQQSCSQLNISQNQSRYYQQQQQVINKICNLDRIQYFISDSNQIFNQVMFQDNKVQYTIRQVQNKFENQTNISRSFILNIKTFFCKIKNKMKNAMTYQQHYQSVNEIKEIKKFMLEKLETYFEKYYDNYKYNYTLLYNHKQKFSQYLLEKDNNSQQSNQDEKMIKKAQSIQIKKQQDQVNFKYKMHFVVQVWKVHDLADVYLARIKGKSGFTVYKAKQLKQQLQWVERMFTIKKSIGKKDLDRQKNQILGVIDLNNYIIQLDGDYVSYLLQNQTNGLLTVKQLFDIKDVQINVVSKNDFLDENIQKTENDYNDFSEQFDNFNINYEFNYVDEKIENQQIEISQKEQVCDYNYEELENCYRLLEKRFGKKIEELLGKSVKSEILIGELSIEWLDELNSIIYYVERDLNYIVDMGNLVENQHLLMDLGIQQQLGSNWVRDKLLEKIKTNFQVICIDMQDYQNDQEQGCSNKQSVFYDCENKKLSVRYCDLLQRFQRVRWEVIEVLINIELSQYSQIETENAINNLQTNTVLSNLQSQEKNEEDSLQCVQNQRFKDKVYQLLKVQINISIQPELMSNYKVLVLMVLMEFVVQDILHYIMIVNSQSVEKQLSRSIIQQLQINVSKTKFQQKHLDLKQRFEKVTIDYFFFEEMIEYFSQEDRDYYQFSEQMSRMDLSDFMVQYKDLKRYLNLKQNELFYLEPMNLMVQGDNLLLNYHSFNENIEKIQQIYIVQLNNKVLIKQDQYQIERKNKYIKVPIKMEQLTVGQSELISNFQIYMVYKDKENNYSVILERLQFYVGIENELKSIYIGNQDKKKIEYEDIKQIEIFDQDDNKTYEILKYLEKNKNLKIKAYKLSCFMYWIMIELKNSNKEFNIRNKKQKMYFSESLSNIFLNISVQLEFRSLEYQVIDVSRCEMLEARVDQLKWLKKQQKQYPVVYDNSADQYGDWQMINMKQKIEFRQIKDEYRRVEDVKNNQKCLYQLDGYQDCNRFSSSIAGKQRHDIILLRDLGGRIITYIDKKPKYKLQILNESFKFYDELEVEVEFDQKMNVYMIGLEWKPEIIGFYKLFVEGQEVQNQRQIYVEPAKIDFQKSVFEFEQTQKLLYFQKYELKCQFQDEFNNLVHLQNQQYDNLFRLKNDNNRFRLERIRNKDKWFVSYWFQIKLVDDLRNPKVQSECLVFRFGGQQREFMLEMTDQITFFKKLELCQQSIINILPDVQEQQQQIQQLVSKNEINNNDYNNDDNIDANKSQDKTELKSYNNSNSINSQDEQNDVKIIDANQSFLMGSSICNNSRQDQKDNVVIIDRFNILRSIVKNCDIFSHYKEQIDFEFKDECNNVDNAMNREFLGMFGEFLVESEVMDFCYDGHLYLHNNIKNSSKYKQIMKTIGSIIGYVLRMQFRKQQDTRLKLNAKLSTNIWTILFQDLKDNKLDIDKLYKKFKFDDLRMSIDSKLYQNYQVIRGYNETKIGKCMMHFIINDNGKQVQLKHNGESIKLNVSNLKEYLQLTTQYYTIDKFKDQLVQMKQGFDLQFPQQLQQLVLKDFNVTELNILINDPNDNQVLRNRLISNISYNCKSTNDQVKKYFRKYLKQIEESKLVEVIRFITAQDYLYPNDQIEVEVRQKHNQWPLANTCKMKLIISNYQNYDRMKTMMDAAFGIGNRGFNRQISAMQQFDHHY